MKTQIEDFGLKDVIRNTSLAGWVLLARPLISFLFSRKRSLNEYASVDASAMVFILYAFIAFGVGWWTINRSESGMGKMVLWKTPILIFLLYSILGIVSMLWSVNSQLTGYRAFECIAMTLLIVAVIEDLFKTGSLKFIFLWSLLFCTFDIILSVIIRSRWDNSILGLLGASQMMATTFFFIALYFVPRQWYNYFIIVMSVFSMSTVSYIGMALGSVSAFWNQGKTKLIAFVGAFCLLLAVIAVGPYKLLKDTIFFDKTDISIEETSGRDHIMKATFESLEENPMGMGFFAGEPYVLYAKGMPAIGGHNSFFSAGLGLGYPGIIIIGVFFIAMGFITISRFISPKYKNIMIGCFCVAFLQCMGNPSVGTRVYGAWMPCMYIFVLICGMYVYGKYIEQEDNEETDN